MSPSSLPSEIKPHRYLELDSLRGLAAASVVLWHFLLLWKDGPYWHLILLSPANVFYGGNAAVLLFFVLSGFVLSLPFLAKPQQYFPYLAKRACRIYLPYVVGLALSIVAWRLSPPLVTGNNWIDDTWPVHHGFGMIAKQFTGLSLTGASVFNTAYWSLVVEIRASIVFPLILWITRRVPLTAVVGATFVVAAAMNGWNPTVFGLLLFLNGSSLAVHFQKVVRGWHAISAVGKWSIAVVCAAVYFYGWTSFYNPQLHRLYGLVWWGSSVASMLFIVVATQALPIRRFLHSRVVLHLGTISYSVYLVHGTVLFTVLHFFWNRTSRLTMFAMYLVGAFALAEAFHYAIEKPTTLLSRNAGAALLRVSAACRALLSSGDPELRRERSLQDMPGYFSN